jgi:hypothetical protein
MNFKHIQHHATAAICALLFGITFLLASEPARAQSQITPEETVKIRAILDEPLYPKSLRSKLETQLQAKQQAALKLGDWPTIEAIYKTSMSLLPMELKYKNQFAALLLQRGNVEQGNALMREVIESSPDPVSRLIFKAIFAQYLSDQTNFVESDNMLRSAQQDLLRLPTRLSPRGEYYVKRTRSGLAMTQSQIHLGQGKYQLAIQQANDSERQAREAIRLVPGDLPLVEQDYAHARLVETLNLKVRVLLSSGNREQLDAVLRTYLQFIQTPQVLVGQQIRAQSVMANIRYSQREFASASHIHLQAIDAMSRLNYEALDARLTAQLSQFSLSLIGQHRYKEALVQLQKLDALAGTDEALKTRVRFAFDRAVVYLYNNKAPEAAALLASEAQALAKQYGSGLAGRQHFFTAQASGLQGVALWRIATAESKARAYPLLQAAVQDIMLPANVDYLENIGIRKEPPLKPTPSMHWQPSELPTGCAVDSFKKPWVMRLCDPQRPTPPYLIWYVKIKMRETKSRDCATS